MLVVLNVDFCSARIALLTYHLSMPVNSFKLSHFRRSVLVNQATCIRFAIVILTALNVHGEFLVAKFAIRLGAA